MYELSAFALTPAAIIKLANVCRHSCKAMGFAFFQAVRARLLTFDGVKVSGAGEAQSLTPARAQLVSDEVVAEHRGAGDATMLAILRLD